MSAFLTRLYLNPQRAESKRALGNVNRLHGQVMNAMGPEYTGRHPLWRVDHDRRKNTLYLVSSQAPDMSAFQEGYGWDSSPATIVDYTPRLDSVSVDQVWSFRLTANPVHPVTYPDEMITRTSRGVQRVQPRVRRIPHETRKHQREWLAHRGDVQGFSILDEPTVTPLLWQRFSKGHGQSVVTVASVTFEGRLTVTDADKFRDALTSGVGRAKAYGCGLLTVAPVR